MNPLLITLGRKYPNDQARLFLPLCLTTTLTTVAELRAAARARVSALLEFPADDAGVRQWALMHMPAATLPASAAPVDVAKLPERQLVPLETLASRWSADVHAALLPVAKRSPASKLLRKGLPIPNSLRYLGLQFNRACAADKPSVLSDVCRAHVLGLTGPVPMDLAELERRWLSLPRDLYATHLDGLRASDLQAVLAGFVASMSNAHACSRRLLRAGLLHTSMAGLYDLLVRIGKPIPADVPSPGFGIFLSCESGLAVCRLLQGSHGQPPSAKRIRSGIEMTPEIQRALGKRARVATAPVVFPLPAIQAAHQHTLPRRRVLVCRNSCGWMRFPLGKATLDLDLDDGALKCSTCGSGVAAVGLNGCQLRGLGNVNVRLCDSCGLMADRFSLRGVGVECEKCKQGRFRDTVRAVAASSAGPRMPRRAAKSLRRNARG